MEQQRLVQSSKLKSTYWKSIIDSNKQQPRVKYNEEMDTVLFFIAPQHGEKIITHYVDPYVALLYRYIDKEIVGLRIESFEQSFLPKYSEVEKVWKLSGVSPHFKDFGELHLAAQKIAPPLGAQLTKATTPLFKASGIELTPVPA